MKRVISGRRASRRARRHREGGSGLRLVVEVELMEDSDGHPGDSDMDGVKC